MGKIRVKTFGDSEEEAKDKAQKELKKAEKKARSASSEQAGEESEEAKNTITEYLKMLLTSEEYTMDQTKIQFDYIFNTKLGRNFFAKNVYLPKFKENKIHCLSNKCFDQMFKIISSAIMSIVQEDNINDYGDAILLTNCLFRYYK